MIILITIIKIMKNKNFIRKGIFKPRFYSGRDGVPGMKQLPIVRRDKFNRQPDIYLHFFLSRFVIPKPQSKNKITILPEKNRGHIKTFK